MTVEYQVCGVTSLWYIVSTFNVTGLCCLLLGYSFYIPVVIGLVFNEVSRMCKLRCTYFPYEFIGTDQLQQV